LKNLATGIGINVKTLYETRGIEPAVNKPDLSLNTENIQKEVLDSNFVLTSNTAEFTYIDFKNNKELVEFPNSMLSTAIYEFDDGNKYADENEIRIESIDSFSNPNNIDRIGAFFHKGSNDISPANTFSSYVNYLKYDIYMRTIKYYGDLPDFYDNRNTPSLRNNNEDGGGLVPSYVSKMRFFAEGILAGETTAEAL